MLKSFTTFEKSEIEAIAIGGFDGLHRGHQALISKLGVKGALLIIHRGGVGLTPGDRRCLYHDKGCMMLELDSIKMMDPEDFIHFIQREFVNLKKIVVGYDFLFGRDRRGDVALLKEKFDGQVEVVNEVFYDGISVHSRHIKSLLLRGEVEKANGLLGRTYAIRAEVVSGQGIGKRELYATLNLKTDRFFIPKEGVYASRIAINERIYPSVTFIGKRVSTDGAFSIETHILDEVIVAEVAAVELFFVAYVRENRKFEDLRDLKVQISRDIQEAKLRL